MDANDHEWDETGEIALGEKFDDRDCVVGRVILGCEWRATGGGGRKATHSRQVKARMPDSTGYFRIRLSRSTCLRSGSNAANSSKLRALMSRTASKSYSFS